MFKTVLFTYMVINAELSNNKTTKLINMYN